MAGGVSRSAAGENAINRKLIVNADDYGLTRGVSKAIRECHLHGLVSSTTAMMNMAGVEADLLQALKACPRLGVGVHLVLTAGSPLVPGVQVKSLLLENGMFPDESGMMARLSSINVEEVRAEWKAQVAKFVSVTGREPDHLDSHHHMSFLSSALFEVMLELAQEHGCAIRFPSGRSAVNILSDLPPEVGKKTLKENLRLVQQCRLAHPDYFMKSFYGDNATRATLIDFLNEMPEGTTEIMCHPGYLDEDLLKNSMYHEGRANELAILTDEEVLRIKKEKNIELINFSDLQYSGISAE